MRIETEDATECYDQTINFCAGDPQTLENAFVHLSTPTKT